MITQIVPELPVPDPAVLDEARVAPPEPDVHDRLASALPCLHVIEYRHPRESRDLGSEVRIAVWNIERCKYPAQSAERLAGIAADVILLCELDVGMARSGNCHTVRKLADALGTGYAFAVEYVELGLGDEREKSWHARQANMIGLHGNAILSQAPLDRIAVIRLDEGARWFAGAQDTGERRIGWRMAIGAVVNAGGSPLFVASAHLESSTDADDRNSQVGILLGAVDVRAQGLPVVIGGDFNTSALPVANGTNPGWFDTPEAYEPLFERFRRAGYEWTSANQAVATERTRPDGTPVPPFRRIDWIFTRGLTASRPRIIAAIDAQGSAISDHEILTIMVSV